MGRLDGKVAIITGSNSGVGAATAKLFAKEGAKVVISARRLPQLEEVAAEIRAEGGEVLIVQTDVSKNEDAINLGKNSRNIWQSRRIGKQRWCIRSWLKTN